MAMYYCFVFGVQGFWFMAYGEWFSVLGLLSMVCGFRRRGLRPRACGLMCMMYGFRLRDLGFWLSVCGLGLCLVFGV